MKNTFLLLLFVAILLLNGNSCFPDREHGVGIKNNSNQVIVVAARYILPDTLLPEDTKKLVTININQKSWIFSPTIGNRNLERLHRGDTLTLFILNNDSVKKHSWEYLRENNVILKRYEFGIEEYKKNEGVINYP